MQTKKNRNKGDRRMKKSHLMYFLLAMMLLVGACAPNQATSNADEVARQIETSVASTIAIGNALTAAVPVNTNTALPPTNTPFPTLTPYPTLTPFVVTPGSGNGGGGTGGGGAYPTQSTRYRCQLLDQNPLAGSPATILKVGDTLDVKWTLKNTGTQTWTAATFSLELVRERVLSDIPANQLLTTHPTPLSIGIGADVRPGKFITLGIELTAPAFDGHDPIKITVTMALDGNGYRFCQEATIIQVQIIRPGMTPIP
jgi:hypothetical protein